MKNEKVIAAQSFKMAQMAARFPQAERGMWGAEPPTKLILTKFEIGNVKNCDLSLPGSGYAELHCRFFI